MISILFVAADPTNTTRLRLSEEVREIQERLQSARLRDNFTLYQRWALRPEDLTQALLDLKPQIIHFSGHGLKNGVLCFENELGEMHPVTPDALASLFEQFSAHVMCVVMNACYSNTQAEAIADHVNYVIGMHESISDKAAIAFAVGFYQAIGAGLSIDTAYRLGCIQIRLQGISEYLTPTLIHRSRVNFSSAIDRTSQSTSDVHHNLPKRNYQQFVGRDQELARIHKLLLPTSNCDVLTIEGIGGVGKSSLALEVAYYYLQNYTLLPKTELFEAIIWVSAKENVLTAQGIAKRTRTLRNLQDVFMAAGITLQREDILRANPDEKYEIFRNAITRQRTLLIIDNLEAAPERIEIMQFLRETPSPTKVIVTLRETLDAPSTIRLREMPRKDALNLIAQCCEEQAITISENEMLKLTDYVSGLPLAIVWSVAQIAYGHDIESLISEFANSKSTVVDFCLNTALRQISNTKAEDLLKAMSLFPVSASKEALTYMVSGDRQVSIDGVLVDLLKLSLIFKTGNRFLTLPLIQRAIISSLDGMKFNHLSRRMAEYFSNLVKHCIGEDIDGNQVEFYALLDVEYSNLLSVMEWCYAVKEWSMVLDFVHALTGGYYGSYLLSRGLWDDQVMWIDHASCAYSKMSLEQQTASKWKIIMLYNSACWTHTLRAEFGAAVELAEKAIQLAETSTDEMGKAVTFRQAGYAFSCIGQLDRAEKCYEQAFQIWTKLEDPIQTATVYNNMASIAIQRGDYVKAETVLAKSINLLRGLKDYSHRLIGALREMGELLCLLNHVEQARMHFEEALRLAEDIEHIRGIAQCKLSLAKISLASNKAQEGYSFIVDAYEVFDKLGMKKESKEAQQIIQSISSKQ